MKMRIFSEKNLQNSRFLKISFNLGLYINVDRNLNKFRGKCVGLLIFIKSQKSESPKRHFLGGKSAIGWVCPAMFSSPLISS